MHVVHVVAIRNITLMLSLIVFLLLLLEGTCLFMKYIQKWGLTPEEIHLTYIALEVSMLIITQLRPVRIYANWQTNSLPIYREIRQLIWNQWWLHIFIYPQYSKCVNLTLLWPFRKFDTKGNCSYNTFSRLIHCNGVWSNDQYFQNGKIRLSIKLFVGEHQ